MYLSLCLDAGLSVKAYRGQRRLTSSSRRRRKLHTATAGALEVKEFRLRGGAGRGRVSSVERSGRKLGVEKKGGRDGEREGRR